MAIRSKPYMISDSLFVFMAMAFAIAAYIAAASFDYQTARQDECTQAHLVWDPHSDTCTGKRELTASSPYAHDFQPQRKGHNHASTKTN